MSLWSRVRKFWDRVSETRTTRTETYTLNLLVNGKPVDPDSDQGRRVVEEFREKERQLEEVTKRIFRGEPWE